MRRKAYPFGAEKSSQLGRELPRKLNHTSSSLAFNLAGNGKERALFGSMLMDFDSRMETPIINWVRTVRNALLM